jgi:hypothetical protein
MAKLTHLKPQDILLALKLHLGRQKPRPRWVDVAQELGMSQAEISGCLKRLIYAGISSPETDLPYPEPLKEFVLHGLKYAFPSHLGPISRGMPTSHAAPPLSKKISSSELYVWPDAKGEIRGSSIEPIYPSAPYAASRDPKLHELLALIDALRIGQAREKKLAMQELEKRLSS